MANYQDSLLVNAQTVLATKYNEAELRRKERPVLQMASKNDYSIPDAAKVRTSEDRTVEVKWLKKKTAGAATAKVAAHTGTKSDSGTTNLVWVTYTETFFTSAKQAQNNVISLERMFQHEMEQAIDNLKDRHETYGLSYLVANRCQIAAPSTSGQGTWDAVNYALEIPVTDPITNLNNYDYFNQKAKNFMRGRYYRGNMDLIPDLILNPYLERTAMNGSNNAVNLGWQMQGTNIAPTSETILSAYANGSALIMPEGTFAAINWNDPLNRSGKINSGMTNVGMVGTLLDPFGSDFVFDVSTYTVRADASATGGGEQDFVDEWEIALTVAYALPPLALASDSPVHLISLVP